MVSPKLFLMVVSISFLCAADEGTLLVRVEGPLPYVNVPFDPVVDFPGAIQSLGLKGVLDPNSIVVTDRTSGETVPHALTEDFAEGDKGHVEWVIEDPKRHEYEIRFSTAASRPALLPAKYTPIIGNGDLLRYNAGVPRPFALPYLSRLVDLTGDGKPDLVGCWNYAYRPGWPWDGIVCFRRVGDLDDWTFGDLVHLRYVENPDSAEFKFASATYMHADFADLNKDGLVDIVYSPSHPKRLFFYLNSGKRDSGDMPVFVAQGDIDRFTDSWGPCRVEDLNKDGALDIVVGSTFLKNENPDGWPVKVSAGIALEGLTDPSFMDIDGDGVLDAVNLEPIKDGDIQDFHATWSRGLGGDPPTFAPAEPVADVAPFRLGYLAGATDGTRRGLLVLHDVFQRISFYEHTGPGPEFTTARLLASESAVMSLSDQAWPCVCDWDHDGDWDLLVGGGYGWPRIVKNSGSSQRPAFADAEMIVSGGKPIRFVRNEILGGKHWHNMGYNYPVYADWDGDGLEDLLFCNETNRIFWYRNVGKKEAPDFGECQQVIVDGCEDSDETRALSVKRAEEQDSAYPVEDNQPFFWRTGGAFADWNGDGLMDLATHDGKERKLTLYSRYRDVSGALRLKRDRQLKLADGRLIDDAVVERAAHWTESFRPVDWDGDGLTDLVYACAGTEASKGSIYLLRNCGDRSNPLFENPMTFCCFGTPIKVTAHGPHPWPGDIDADGKPDLVTCVEWSVYPTYRYAALMMKERPKYSIEPLGR